MSNPKNVIGFVTTDGETFEVFPMGNFWQCKSKTQKVHSFYGAWSGSLHDVQEAFERSGWGIQFLSNSRIVFPWKVNQNHKIAIACNEDHSLIILEIDKWLFDC